MQGYILGIDPGLKFLGWGILLCTTPESVRYVNSGVHVVDCWSKHPLTAAFLHSGFVRDLLQKYAIIGVGIEDYVYRRDNALRSWSNINMARLIGHLCEVCRAVRLKPYPARTWQHQLLGKKARQDKVRDRDIDYVLQLRITHLPERLQEHERQGLAVALIHADTMRLESQQPRLFCAER